MKNQGKKVGIHTPNRTTTFYNYLINQGLDVQDDSWKNDTCDSFLVEDLKIMLPNTSEELDYNQFIVFRDEYYGTDKCEENLIQFDNVRELANFLKTI